MSVGVKVRCSRCRGTMLRDECVACGYSPSWAAEAAKTRALVESGELSLTQNRTTMTMHDAGGRSRLKARMEVERRQMRMTELDEMIRRGIRETVIR